MINLQGIRSFEKRETNEEIARSDQEELAVL